eukprot:7703570-Pyramimonas_sp.AAC.1
MKASGQRGGSVEAVAVRCGASRANDRDDRGAVAVSLGGRSRLRQLGAAAAESRAEGRGGILGDRRLAGELAERR